MVREDLSSPASVISEAEVETTLPATVDPSRMVTVACGRSDSLVAQEHNRRNVIRGTAQLFSMLIPGRVIFFRIRGPLAKVFLLDQRLRIGAAGNQQRDAASEHFFPD